MGHDLEELGHTESPKGPFGNFLRWLAVAGGWVLMALMFYTVTDVVARYIFNRPFRGSLEITEFSMAVIVFLGIAYCGWVGSHVAVDIFERPLENPRLRFIPVLLTLVSALLFAAIAWLTASDAIFASHRISNMMRWPHWPFQAIVAFGAAMYATVLFMQCVRMLRGNSQESK